MTMKMMQSIKISVKSKTSKSKNFFVYINANVFLVKEDYVETSYLMFRISSDSPTHFQPFLTL